MKLIKQTFRLFIFFGIVLISSCKEGSDNENKICKSKSSEFIFLISDRIDKFKIKNELSNDTQSEIRQTIIDSVNYLGLKIVENTGGISTETGQLLNGCKDIKNQIELFLHYRKEVIGKLYNKLDSKDKNSLHFIDILNRNLYAPDHYFNKGYLESTDLNQFTNDFLIFQLNLLNQ